MRVTSSCRAGCLQVLCVMAYIYRNLFSGMKSTRRCRRISLLGTGLTVTVALVLLMGQRLGSWSHYDKGQLAMTPPMGWNSWNTFKCDGLNEKLVKGMADALISTGLAEAGYTYVNLDDCWQIDRDKDGIIQPDISEKGFKNGIKSLADYIHSKGLKFGLYTAFGTLTCKRRPGSHGYEALDAKTYASWGVDFLKNDDCTMYPTLNILEDYQRMWDAINQTKRPMIHSVKNVINVESAQLVSHMRRVGKDIHPNWDSILSLVDLVVEEGLWKFARPGFWNDLDMLEIGNEGLSESENIGHMALWCAFKAPLLLGNDIRKMPNFTLHLLTHNEFLSVLKDPVGKSVQLVHASRAVAGSAQHQVVSKRCNPTDPSQIWLYDEQKKSLTNKQTGQCLTAGWRDYVYLDECDPGVETQQWRIDFNTRQIHKNESHCLNTVPVVNSGSRILACYKRRSAKDFQKQNREWMAYNDAFNTEVVSENAYVFSNSKKRCPSVGGPPELQIFAGPLVNERHVAVLLNRDNKPQDITLKWEYIPEMHISKQYTVRDLYQRRDLGHYKETFTSTVDAHSVLMITLTPS